MTNQKAAFELRVHLCKPQYKSTGVDKLLISCLNFWYWLLISHSASFHKYDKIFASNLYRHLQAWGQCYKGFTLVFYKSSCCLPCWKQ